MASGFNIYSQLLISIIRNSDHLSAVNKCEIRLPYYKPSLEVVPTTLYTKNWTITRAQQVLR